MNIQVSSDLTNSVLKINDINFGVWDMSIKHYYETLPSLNEQKSMDNFILSRKEKIFIKSFRILISIARYFKTIGYYQGFHYIAIFLSELDYSEEVQFYRSLSYIII